MREEEARKGKGVAVVAMNQSSHEESVKKGEESERIQSIRENCHAEEEVTKQMKEQGKRSLEVFLQVMLMVLLELA